MLRKFALVIIAVSTLSVASLSPTPASAWRGGWHGGWLVRRWMGLAWRMGAGMASWLGTCLGTWMGTCLGTWMGTCLGTWMGMGRTTFRRGARILRTPMCRPACCPWTVGAASDSRQQVLVTKRSHAWT